MKYLITLTIIALLATNGSAIARDGSGGGSGGSGDGNGRAFAPLAPGAAANASYADRNSGPSAVLVLQLVFGTRPDTSRPTRPPKHDDDCMSCP